MARWFRFYDDALNDPKVQHLPAAMFKHWVNILCVASQRDGSIPSADQLAFLLRLPTNRVKSILGFLTARGLLDKSETGHSPHNWNKRQYKSDVSNERVKQHRERARAGTCNVTVTPSETEPQ